MINMIQNAKDQVLALTGKAYEKAAAAGKLPADVSVRAGVEIPKDAANGDYTTTFALAAAKAMKMRPRDIAEILLENLDLSGSYFASAEIAGTGFLNFRLSPAWYAGVMHAVESEGPAYGRSDALAGRKIMVEFVSANPTGPMHMGNARGGVLGDTLAAVLEAGGAQVWREFYVNDAGNQIEKFANSLEARYLQIILGEDAVTFPEDGYHGDDIKDLARAYYDAHGDGLKDVSQEERHAALAKFGLERNIPKMQEDLRRYKIEYDQWFFESELHESGYVAETVDKLTEAGYTYEQEGALWLATSRILEENLRKAGKSDKDIAKLDLKDDVLRRANGFYTYFAADIAYHRNKLEERKFDLVINIWGADHHGHVARLKGAMDAIGLEGDKLDIVLMQLVRLMKDGEPYRMSKRSGRSITLADLIQEIPIDAARYFFNMREPGSSFDFDLDLAVKEQSDNPVYYVQYAHARICSILKNLRAEGIVPRPVEDGELELLASPEERELIRRLGRLPQELIDTVRDYDPARLTRYVYDVATLFHKFYNTCRVKGEADNLQQARLALCTATRTVIANVLGILKISAPEVM